MKTMREDKSDRKVERENRVAKIFHELNGKELTIEKTVDEYVEKYRDDNKMNYRLMSVILKSMCDMGMLEKRWIHSKENKSGRVQNKTVIYYRESKNASLVYDEAKNANIKAPLPPSENKIENRLTEPSPAVFEFKKDEPKKEEVKKEEEPKKKLNVNSSEMLSFDEALGRLYRGSKVVSSVSGNIYAMIAGKGITSTTNPGAIITVFPTLEMEGSWRVFESPKACPFCGYPVRLNHETLGEKAYYYVCTNHSCMAHGPRALTPEQAVVKFNART